MKLLRRSLLTAAAGVPVLALGMPARAALADYPLHCDPELRPVLERAALAYLARTDIRVHVLPTSEGLLVPQVAHSAQSDIVVTSPETIAALAAIGHGVPDAPHPSFSGRLVLAARTATSDDDAKGGPIAAPDPVPSARFDSAAVLAGLGLSRALVQGTIDTTAAAASVAAGRARAGLMTVMDARATPGLRVVMAVPDSVHAPLIYIATTDQSPLRPQPAAFVSFLASADGLAILKAYGLEPTP
jgi:molybdate transport system substrate-binding protein